MHTIMEPRNSNYKMMMLFIYKITFMIMPGLPSPLPFLTETANVTAAVTACRQVILLQIGSLIAFTIHTV